MRSRPGIRNRQAPHSVQATRVAGVSGCRLHQLAYQRLRRVDIAQDHSPRIAPLTIHSTPLPVKARDRLQERRRVARLPITREDFKETVEIRMASAARQASLAFYESWPEGNEFGMRAEPWALAVPTLVWGAMFQRSALLPDHAPTKTTARVDLAELAAHVKRGRGTRGPGVCFVACGTGEFSALGPR